MNPLRNIQAVTSAAVGFIGGGPVGAAGWAVKAITPAQLPLAGRAAIGALTTIGAATTSYFLANGGVDAGVLVVQLQFMGGQVGEYATAGLTALATAASYAIGPSAGAGTTASPPKTRPQFRRT